MTYKDKKAATTRDWFEYNKKEQYKNRWKNNLSRTLSHKLFYFPLFSICGFSSYTHFENDQISGIIWACFFVSHSFLEILELEIRVS